MAICEELNILLSSYMKLHAVLSTAPFSMALHKATEYVCRSDPKLRGRPAAGVVFVLLIVRVRYGTVVPF